MRKSIYTNSEFFSNCYNKICALLNEGTEVDAIPEKLDSEYLPKEIKLLLNDLGLVKHFQKVDKIQIVYRILSIIVFLQFVLNFLFVVFFASLAKDTPSANVDFAFFSIPILLSLVGIFLSILLVINSFWENHISTVIIFISFLFFSQVYTDTFIIFNSTSIFYWVPILIFISTFLLTIRLAQTKRARILRLLKMFKQNGIERSSIPEEFSIHSQNNSESNILKSYSKKPNPKDLFKNLPYKVKKNPTESDLRKWIYKKKINNIILLVLTSILILFIITLIIFSPRKDFNVYEMIQFIFVIACFNYLLLKRNSLNKIDDEYLSNALNEIKGNS